MHNNLAFAHDPRISRKGLLSGARGLAVTTIALCMSCVAAGVTVNTIRHLKTYAYTSVTSLVGAQADVLGFLAIVLALFTAGAGLSYVPTLATRLSVSRSHARTVQTALGVCTSVTIGLHVIAIGAAGAFTIPLGQLLVPFDWREAGVPYPVAAGVLGLWLVAVAAVLRFSRRPRYGVLWGLLLVAVALGVLHTVLLAGWTPGWSVG